MPLLSIEELVAQRYLVGLQACTYTSPSTSTLSHPSFWQIWQLNREPLRPAQSPTEWASPPDYIWLSGWLIDDWKAVYDTVISAQQKNSTYLCEIVKDIDTVFIPAEDPTISEETLEQAELALSGAARPDWTRTWKQLKMRNLNPDTQMSQRNLNKRTEAQSPLSEKQQKTKCVRSVSKTNCCFATHFKTHHGGITKADQQLNSTTQHKQ